MCCALRPALRWVCLPMSVEGYERAEGCVAPTGLGHLWEAVTQGSARWTRSPQIELQFRMTACGLGYLRSPLWGFGLNNGAMAGEDDFVLLLVSRPSGTNVVGSLRRSSQVESESAACGHF